MRPVWFSLRTIFGSHPHDFLQRGGWCYSTWMLDYPKEIHKAFRIFPVLVSLRLSLCIPMHWILIFVQKILTKVNLFSTQVNQPPVVGKLIKQAVNPKHISTPKIWNQWDHWLISDGQKSTLFWVRIKWNWKVMDKLLVRISDQKFVHNFSVDCICLIIVQSVVQGYVIWWSVWERNSDAFTLFLSKPSHSFTAGGFLSFFLEEELKYMGSKIFVFIEVSK